jgi:hypothetical protein
MGKSARRFKEKMQDWGRVKEKRSTPLAYELLAGQFFDLTIGKVLGLSFLNRLQD